ncbi:hypothetical protein VTK26DRAFT_2896 [Humicola hyalothermophila]
MCRAKSMCSDLSLREAFDVKSLGENRGFVGITHDRELASFNKISNTEIAVPGMPPLFCPPTSPLRLPYDTDNRFLRSESARYNDYFEPLLRSVEAMAPDVDVFGTADVVCNAGVLHKLFRIFCNTAERSERFDLEFRGNAVLLSNWKNDPSYEFTFGFGTGFEQATCCYPVFADAILKQRSESHHRVVSYRFAGLQCVVQSEVDAYYCACNHSQVGPPSRAWDGALGRKKRRAVSESSTCPLAQRQQQQQQQAILPPRNSRSASLSLTLSSPFSLLSLDDPGDSPTALTFSPELPPTPSTPDSTISPAIAAAATTTSPSGPYRLQIHHTHNPPIPAHCLIELKTRTADNAGNPKNSDSPPPEAQLYFSRRNMLYVARHRKGLFFTAAGAGHEGSGCPDPGARDGYDRVRDMTGELRAWEASRPVQKALGKVGGLLRVVRDRMMDLADAGDGASGRRMSLVCKCDGSRTEQGVEVGLWEGEER